MMEQRLPVELQSKVWAHYLGSALLADDVRWAKNRPVTAKELSWRIDLVARHAWPLGCSCPWTPPPIDAFLLPLKGFDNLTHMFLPNYMDLTVTNVQKADMLEMLLEEAEETRARVREWRSCPHLLA